LDIAINPVKPLVRLDPRTKFLILITVGAFVLTGLHLGIELAIFTVLFLLLLSQRLSGFAIKTGCVFLILLCIDQLIAVHLSGWFGILVLAISRFPRFIVLIFMAAQLLMKTTTVSEFTAAFHKMHIPEKVIIPFSVMFRFFPTIKEEWQSINNAMRLRGIGSSVGAVMKSPLQTLEYGMIPMLMSVATISSELAAASLSRGLDAEIERTCITEVKFSAIDAIMIILCVTLAVYRLVLA